MRKVNLQIMRLKLVVHLHDLLVAGIDIYILPMLKIDMLLDTNVYLSLYTKEFRAYSVRLYVCSVI